jgi:hypothetical protein
MVMDKIEQDGFRLQITSSENNTIVSGDINFDLGTKKFIVTLHNNGKKFVSEEKDKAIMLALLNWLQCEI